MPLPTTLKVILFSWFKGETFLLFFIYLFFLHLDFRRFPFFSPKNSSFSLSMSYLPRSFTDFVFTIWNHVDYGSRTKNWRSRGRRCWNLVGPGGCCFERHCLYPPGDKFGPHYKSWLMKPSFSDIRTLCQVPSDVDFILPGPNESLETVLPGYCCIYELYIQRLRLVLSSPRSASYIPSPSQTCPFADDS